MINLGTIFKSADNTTLKKVKHLNTLKQNKKLKIDNISISVVVSCKRYSKLIKKSDIIKTLIVRTKNYNFLKYKGTKFYNNSIVLLKENKIYSNKIIGLIPSIIKKYTYKSKINLKKVKFI